MADKKISQLTAATTPLAGTEVLPIVQSGSTVKVSSDDLTVKNVRSNATTGLLQIAGPGAGTTRTMTVPNANFTAARTDAAQTFTGTQKFASTAGNGLNIYGGSGTNQWDIYLNAANLRISDNTGGGSVRIDANTELQGGNLVVGTAAKGIDFSANTGAAGMTSELLNWYEEGTFTPVVIGTSTAGTGTYSRQIGRYTRIGNRVLFNIALEWSAHTGSGDMQVNGLPFTSNSTTGNFHAATAFYSNITLTAGNVLILGIGNNSTKIDFQQTPTGGGASTLVALDVAASIIISGHYEV